MKRNIILLLIFVALFVINSASLRANEGQQAYVEKVMDGDTIGVRLLSDSSRVKVRILGIDCPESHKNAKCDRDGKAGRQGCAEQVPLGLNAAKRAAELLKGVVVTLEAGSKDGKLKKDRYGRFLAYVRLPDGGDYGLVMLQERQCEDFSWKYPHHRMKEYKGVTKKEVR